MSKKRSIGEVLVLIRVQLGGIGKLQFARLELGGKGKLQSARLELGGRGKLQFARLELGGSLLGVELRALLPGHQQLMDQVVMAWWLALLVAVSWTTLTAASTFCVWLGKS